MESKWSEVQLGKSEEGKKQRGQVSLEFIHCRMRRLGYSKRLLSGKSLAEMLARGIESRRWLTLSGRSALGIIAAI